MTTVDYLVIAAALAGVAILIWAASALYGIPGRKSLQQWATTNGYKLTLIKQYLYRAGPYWVFRGGATIFEFVAQSQDGELRCGWARRSLRLVSQPVLEVTFK